MIVHGRTKEVAKIKWEDITPRDMELLNAQGRELEVNGDGKTVSVLVFY